MTIFVDIDGVLMDFVATLEGFGIVLPPIQNYAFKQDNISEYTRTSVFLAMEHQDYAALGVPCKKAIKYFQELAKHEDVRVLTARVLHKEATVRWIHEHLGDFQVKFTTYPKAEFLWLGDKLFDDCPKHLTKPGACIPCVANKKQIPYLSEVLLNAEIAFDFTCFAE